MYELKKAFKEYQVIVKKTLEDFILYESILHIAYFKKGKRQMEKHLLEYLKRHIIYIYCIYYLYILLVISFVLCLWEALNDLHGPPKPSARL